MLLLGAAVITAIVVALALRGRDGDGDRRTSSMSHQRPTSEVTATSSIALRPGPRGAPPKGAPAVPVATLDEIDRRLDPQHPQLIVEVIDVLGPPTTTVAAASPGWSRAS
ncbi:MAG: hypothetical protein H6Q90_3635 [Deltaproteobacteria bacterium]|nr:hypothetical protein [Deltaproteobacteria bacterium]